MPGMDLSILHALIFLIFTSTYKIVVQSLSHVPLFVTPWTEACQAPLSTTISWSLFIFTSIESTMLSNHLILCCPLLLLTSICPSIRVFSSELAVHIRWPKYWSFSFSLLYGLSPLYMTISLVQFSHSVMSDYLQPHGLQHARLPCPSPTPGAYSNSCPLSWWCHPTISFSVIPFSSCLQSFPASGAFQMSQFFASGGQSIGVSASASVLPMNIQDWVPLGWTSYISLQSKELWLYGPLSAKWCLCFLIHCLTLSELSIQGASIF